MLYEYKTGPGAVSTSETHMISLARVSVRCYFMNCSERSATPMSPVPPFYNLPKGSIWASEENQVVSDDGRQTVQSPDAETHGDERSGSEGTVAENLLVGETATAEGSAEGQGAVQGEVAPEKSKPLLEGKRTVNGGEVDVKTTITLEEKDGGFEFNGPTRTGKAIQLLRIKY